jgi:hypothetical protein
MRASFAFLPVKQIGAQKSPAIHRQLALPALLLFQPSHSFWISYFRIHF